MQYDKRICDLMPGDEIEGFYVLKKAAQKTTSAGKPYLSAVLCDRTGTIETVMWSYVGTVGTAEEGEIVKIRGTVSEYRGALQISLERLRLATEQDPVDRSALVPTAPIDPESTFAGLLETVDGFSDPDYRSICRTLLERHRESLMRIPAAKSCHHGFIGGLLMHTADMLRLADFLAAQYADTVERDLLLAGTILHDLCKDREFVFSGLGLATDYSVEGELVGHLVMGAREVAEAAAQLGIPEEKSVLLQHMILSHHGEPEYGAAVRPVCAESELLSYIDRIDSRMEIYRETFAEMPEPGFSGRVFALDKRIYRHRRDD